MRIAEVAVVASEFLLRLKQVFLFLQLAQAYHSLSDIPDIKGRMWGTPPEKNTQPAAGAGQAGRFIPEGVEYDTQKKQLGVPHSSNAQNLDNTLQFGASALQPRTGNAGSKDSESRTLKTTALHPEGSSRDRVLIGTGICQAQQQVGVGQIGTHQS
jgi:hypothetical protein